MPYLILGAMHSRSPPATNATDWAAVAYLKRLRIGKTDIFTAAIIMRRATKAWVFAASSMLALDSGRRHQHRNRMDLMKRQSS